MTTETDVTQIGTVWGLREGVVLCCFRAVLAADGRILRTMLGETEDHQPADNRDFEIAARLRRRYGDDLDLRVVADGGRSYDQFLDAVRHQRRPVPPAATPPPAAPGPTAVADQPTLFS